MRKFLLAGAAAVVLLAASVAIKAQVAGKTVGQYTALAFLWSDPTTASALARVTALGDAQALSGQYAGVTQAVPVLLNAAGSYDQGRSAAGTVGIPVVNWEGTKATYRAAATALVTVTGATDVFQICGSGTKTVRVSEIAVSGTIQTAAQYVDVTVVKRSTADTMGTSSAPTLVPVDANDAAGTAALLQFTANPTLGTGVGTIAAQRYFGALTGTAALMPPAAVFDFGNRPGARELVLRGAAQCAAVNLNAPGNAGTFDIQAEFTEE